MTLMNVVANTKAFETKFQYLESKTMAFPQCKETRALHAIFVAVNIMIEEFKENRCGDASKRYGMFCAALTPLEQEIYDLIDEIHKSQEQIEKHCEDIEDVSREEKPNSFFP